MFGMKCEEIVTRLYLHPTLHQQIHIRWVFHFKIAVHGSGVLARLFPLLSLLNHPLHTPAKTHKHIYLGLQCKKLLMVYHFLFSLSVSPKRENTHCFILTTKSHKHCRFTRADRIVCSLSRCAVLFQVCWMKSIY